MLLHSAADPRELTRHIRKHAVATGTVGWARRRSDGSVEILAHRPDGLQDFLARIDGIKAEHTDIVVEREASDGAEGERSFRIRREELILDPRDADRYSRLGIDTSTRLFPVLHSSGLLDGADSESARSVVEHWRER